MQTISTLQSTDRVQLKVYSVQGMFTGPNATKSVTNLNFA